MPCRRPWRWATAVVCAGLLVTAWAVVGSRGPRAGVVEDAAAPDGWKVIEYQGVRVDVPDDWDRVGQDGCEFRFERWAAPGAEPCTGGGVAFYASATFDPAQGPGVRRTAAARGEPAWGGYTSARDLAVYASDDRRSVVATILGSVTASR